jgi:transcriptional regulator with XRE-family HTH domain
MQRQLYSGPGPGGQPVPEIRRILAHKIRCRLSDLHDKMTAVAARAHCSRSALYAIIRGEVSVGIERVAALAAALDSKASYLRDGSEFYPAWIRAEIDEEQPMDIRLLLARNLAYWRAQRGFFHLESLAQAASISKSTLYSTLNARCDIGIDPLARLGHALDIEPARLVAER